MNWNRALTILLVVCVALMGVNIALRALIVHGGGGLASWIYAGYLAIASLIVAYCACASIIRDRWNR